MSYFDTLNQFNINLNNFLNDKHIENLGNISLFKENVMKAYKSSSSLIKKIEELIATNNNETKLILDNYQIAIADIEETVSRDIANYTSVLQFNTDSLEENLKNKIEETEKDNINLDNKKFLVNSKSRDRINDLDITKNLNNISFQAYIPDIEKKYNDIVNKFNSKKEIRNNLNHSKNSKDLFTFQEATTSVVEGLKKKIEDIKKSISILNDEINHRKKLSDQAILNNEIQLNDTIAQITSSYNNQTNINSIQTDIELSSLNDELELTKKKYNDERAHFLHELMTQFSLIDTTIDNLTLEFKKKKDEIERKNSLIIHKLEMEYNEVFKKNLNLASSNKRISYSQAKKTNKICYKKLLLQKRLMATELRTQEKKYRLSLEELKYKKYYFDLNKTKNIDIVNVNEDNAIYNINKKIEYVNESKKNFEAILNNKISIDVNNEKRKKDIDNLYISSAFKTFETSRQANILTLFEKQKDNESDLRLTIELQNIVNNRYYLDEKLQTKLNDLTTVLDIEKNKYLSKFNEYNVNHHINLNNIHHNYLKSNETEICNKNLQLYDNNISFNKASIVNFKEYTSLESMKEKAMFHYANNKLRTKKNYDLSVSKCNLHINKLNLDNTYLTDFMKYSSEIFLENNNVIISFLIKIIDHISLHLTNSEKIVNSINTITNYYLDFYINYLVQIEDTIDKAIDNRIHFELGSKYDIMLNEINSNYDNKKASLDERKSSIDKTISNYKNALHKFYLELQANEVKVNSAKKKHNKKSIKEYLVKIKELNKKINKNNSLIEELRISIQKFPQLEEKLEIERRNELEYVEIKKQQEVSINYITINKIKKITSDFKLQLENQINSFKFDHVVILKNTKKAFNSFSLKTTTSFNNYLHRINSALHHFFSHEASNLKRVKSSYYHNYLTTLHEIEDNNRHSLKQINAKLNNNLNDYKNISSNYNNSNKEAEAIYQTNINKNLNKYEQDITLEGKEYRETKQKYIKLFYACDLNSKSIIKNITSEIDLNEKNYKKKTEETVEKETNEKIAIKSGCNTKKLNAKRTLLLLPKYLKDEKKNTIQLYTDSNLELSRLNLQMNDNLKQYKRDNEFDINIYSYKSNQKIKSLKRKFIKDSQTLKSKKNHIFSTIKKKKN